MMRDVKIVVLTVAAVCLFKAMTPGDVKVLKSWGYRAYSEVFK